MKTHSLPVHRLFVLALVAGALTGCHHKEVTATPGTINDSGIATNAPTVSAPAVAQFTADPLAINLGDPVVLNWRTQNADTVTIDGIGTVAPSGTQTVMPSSSTNFHLTAKGPGGSTEANVRVTVRVPSDQNAMTDTSSGSGDESAFHAAVQDAFFDYDSFDLRPDAKQATANAAIYLNAHPNIKVLVAGYCDERGSAEYNLALGESRANAAKTGLVNAGVNASRIRVVSYGKEKQICTESTEACWQQNRRAQFNIDR